MYMGHMQTETPYYQRAPNAAPYTIGRFPTDPSFGDCAGAAGFWKKELPAGLHGHRELPELHDGPVAVQPVHQGQHADVLFNDTTANGEVAAWLPLALALGGGDMGLGNGTTGAGSGDVYVDPGLWGSAKSCAPPCTYVLPPATLKTRTTIKFPPSTTRLEVGWTTTAMDLSNMPIPDGFTATVITPQPSVVPPPFVVTDSPDPSAKHPPNSRTITPKPWP
ncbi:hypothetical protein B0T24DRAFT_683390 [Lasiosphaeria ovina]|uniref:Uncharacterized protein n=1 Tax=Lasiosphaeria ovina TaxID=92902 RepID=A0AAE0JVH8_9PEZI|nr:hypothetical protein B0T24DRAFT_683390 [Lasiosphaeria ovina]